jgi:hypothetical protein
MADDSGNYHRHILPHTKRLGEHIMSGNNIISKIHAPRNGRNADAFAEAFNIPTNDNQIIVRATRQFELSLTGLKVGRGSTGRIVEMTDSGRSLLVDFGLAASVVRFPVGSDLIEFVEAVSDESD